MKVRTNKYIIGMLFCGALLTATSCSDDFLQKDSLTSVLRILSGRLQPMQRRDWQHVMMLCRMVFCIMMPQTRTNGTVVVLSTWMP